MNRPLLPSQCVSNLLSGRQNHSRQPAFLSFRGLQVKPYRPAVGAEELMPGNLHFHGSSMNLTQASAVGPDGPDAVHLVPGAFVTEHEQARICGRELNVIEPV